MTVKKTAKRVAKTIENKLTYAQSVKGEAAQLLADIQAIVDSAELTARQAWETAKQLWNTLVQLAAVLARAVPKLQKLAQLLKGLRSA